MNRKIFFVLGESGAGKTTLINKSLCRLKNVSRMNKCTTREKRSLEDSNDIFLNEEQFDQFVKKNLFIEWEEYAGIKHGLLKSSMDIQNHLITEITPNGYFNFLKYLKNNNIKEEIFTIYIHTNKKLIEKRLKKYRKIKNEDFLKRLEDDKKQFSNKINYNIIIENNKKDSFKIFLNFIKEKIGEKND